VESRGQLQHQLLRRSLTGCRLLTGILLINGIDISENDKAFIGNIPELPSSEIPVLDGQSQYLEYFDEFVESGK
jgi:hypothetical protein